MSEPVSMASLSQPFIYRPVGTALLTLAVALAGMLAYTLLPVSALPQVDFRRSAFPPACRGPTLKRWLPRWRHRLRGSSDESPA